MNDVIIPVKQDYDEIDSIDSTVENESHNSDQEKDKPHNGKPITSLEVSPNGKYLVTYSENDHSIVGWDVKDIDKGFKIGTEERQLKPITVQTVEINRKYKLNQLRVSDDKKLVCIYTYEGRNFLSK